MSCHLYAFINIFWVGIYITYLVYSSKIISKYKHPYNSKYIQKYLENWNSYPITNITLVDDESDCYSSDDEEILTFAKFPGTEVFCDCNGSLSNDFCKNPEKEECHTIYFFPDQLDVKKWKNKYFCAIKLNMSYDELRKYEKDKNENCKKNCGFFDSSKNTILCFDDINNSNCPINGIKIKTKNNRYNKVYIDDINEKEDDENNDDNSESFDIEIIRDENLSIMTNITLSSGETVCSHPYEGLFGQSEFKYNKLKGNNICSTSINDSNNDERYTFIDKTEFEKLGKYNLFYNNYVNISKELKDSYNNEVSISYMGYFHMSNDIYNDKFKEKRDIVKISLSNGLMITVIVFSSIFLLINAGFCIFAVLSCLEICDLREEYLDEPLFAELVIKYIGWVLNFIFLLIINIKYFKKRKSIKNTIKDSFDNDKISIYAYDLACDNFYKVKTLLIIFDILFGVEIISIILGNIMLLYCPSELGNDY